MEILITLLINLVTTFLKKNVKEKYGVYGVHAVVFLLALIASGIVAYSQFNVSFAEFLKQAGVFLASSIAMYEVILKRLNFNMSVTLDK